MVISDYVKHYEWTILEEFIRIVQKFEVLSFKVWNIKNFMIILIGTNIGNKLILIQNTEGCRKLLEWVMVGFVETANQISRLKTVKIIHIVLQISIFQYWHVAILIMVDYLGEVIFHIVFLLLKALHYFQHLIIIFKKDHRDLLLTIYTIMHKKLRNSSQTIKHTLKLSGKIWAFWKFKWKYLWGIDEQISEFLFC